MSLNVKLQVYRGLLANLPPTTGSPGVLAWTTDSNELYIDTGTAFQRVSANNRVFNVASPAALTSLAGVQLGDLALSASDNKTYILNAFPSSNAANWVAIAVTSGTTIQGLGSPVAHEWVAYIDNNGVQHLSQPSFADISGLLAQTQLPATIGAGSSLTAIDLGTF